MRSQILTWKPSYGLKFQEMHLLQLTNFMAPRKVSFILLTIFGVKVNYLQHLQQLQINSALAKQASYCMIKYLFKHRYFTKRL